MSQGEAKTEKPTPKRRREAREQGRVPRSSEINSAVVLIATVGALAMLAPSMLRRCEDIMRTGLARTADPSNTGGLVKWALEAVALTAGPLLLTAAAAGLLANVAQVRIRLSPKAMKPSLKKLDPLQGLKRVFGPSGLVETGKALLKTAAIGFAAFAAVWPQLPKLASLVGLPPGALLHEAASRIRDLGFKAGAAIAAVAALDYAWQRYRHEKQLKMTRAELKQELKQSDVSPQVKRALRRKQLQMAKKRMLADVPTADVVVTNPTHYAVALRYDGSTTAPEVIAKGADLVAQAIREVAEEHGVPIVQNPPLARALYREVELGQMIPEAFFAAVAEVLAFVYRTARRGPRLKPRARRPNTGANAVRPSSRPQLAPGTEG